jgi:hypothetical protein
MLRANGVWRGLREHVPMRELWEQSCSTNPHNYIRPVSYLIISPSHISFELAQGGNALPANDCSSSATRVYSTSQFAISHNCHILAQKPPKSRLLLRLRGYGRHDIQGKYKFISNTLLWRQKVQTLNERVRVIRLVSIPRWGLISFFSAQPSSG